MTDWITAAALGVIEGITEFLPVSSTGHLLIAQHWLPRQSDLFNVVIQCGAVLAVIPLFHERFRQFIFRWRDPAVLDYLLKIIVAFVITGAGGFILEKKGIKLTERFMPVAAALLVGGVLFIVVERWLKKQNRPGAASITWTVALAVGFGQLVAAIFPGASRSGTTIIMALILGCGRPLATEFSFLVGIPTMMAAGGYKIFKAFHHPDPLNPVHEDWTMVLIASVVAAVVSFIVVKWFLRYVQTHSFNAFGWYRIVLGALIFVGIFTHVLVDETPAKPAPKAVAMTQAHSQQTATSTGTARL